MFAWILHANGLICLICLLHSYTQNQLNPDHMFIHNYSIVNTVECDCDHMNQKFWSLFHQCYWIYTNVIISDDVYLHLE